MKPVPGAKKVGDCCCKRMAKGNSLNRKEMIKEGNLKHQGEKKEFESKIWVNTIDFPFPVMFSNYV